MHRRRDRRHPQAHLRRAHGAGVLKFGRQRPPRDLAAIALLFLGFSAVALALWIARGTYVGALLPLAFALGAWAGLQSELREVELRDDRLLLRTFFKTYTIPRAHVTTVGIDARGVFIDVINGNRYPITPRSVDADEMLPAVTAWHRTQSNG